MDVVSFLLIFSLVRIYKVCNHYKTGLQIKIMVIVIMK